MIDRGRIGFTTPPIIAIDQSGTALAGPP